MHSSVRRLVASLASVVLGVALLGACGGDEEKQADADSSAAAEGSAVDTLIQTGLEQVAAGDDATARTTFANVLRLDPGNVYGHYNLGLIEQNAGRDAQAIEEYDAALATDPAFTSALYNRAILTEPSDLEEAVELYRRAVDADSEFAAAHMRLGFALVHLGETVEGEGHLGTGISLDPSMADVVAPSYR